MGDDLGVAFGDTRGDPLGDFNFFLSLDLVLLESSCFARSSALILISFSLSGESGTAVAATVASLLGSECVDMKGLKLMSRYPAIASVYLETCLTISLKVGLSSGCLAQHFIIKE